MSIDSKAKLEDKHIPRLRGLHASAFPSSVKDIWERLLVHPDVICTQMETLDIGCFHGSDTVTLEIPNTLHFRNRQPSLTTLILRTCITDLRSSLFSNLIFLSVQQIHHSPLSVPTWLKILETMPKLVKLDLGNATLNPHTNDQRLDVEPRKMVQLRHLQSFSIWESICGGSALFVNIIPTLSCLLDVSLVGSWTSDESIAIDNAVIKRYSEKFAHDINTGFSHSLKIETLPMSMHFDNQSDHNLIYGTPQRKAAFGYLYLQNHDSNQQLLSLLFALDNVLPSVTTLSLGLHQSYPDIVPHLQKFTGVTTLNLLPPVELPDMVKNALFPSLRVITYCSTFLIDIFYPKVMSVLQWRRAHSNNFTAIECIRFLRKANTEPHYSLSADEIQSLNDLGVRVESISVDKPID